MYSLSFGLFPSLFLAHVSRPCTFCRFSSFGSRFSFVCYFLSVRFLFFASRSPVASYLTKAPNFQVKLGLSKILLCLRFDSLINLLVRTKVENVLSHYLSNVVVVVIVFVDPKVVNAVFMLACVRLCRILHILCSVGSSTSICLPFIYTCRYIVCDSDARKDIPITVSGEPYVRICARERWRACARARLRFYSDEANGHFGYTGATHLCSVNNNVTAII